MTAKMRVWRCKLGGKIEESDMEQLEKVLINQYGSLEPVLGEMKRAMVWQRTELAFYRLSEGKPIAP